MQPLAFGANSTADQQEQEETRKRSIIKYRVCRVRPSSKPSLTELSSIPCIGCPVFENCYPGGDVSPEKCVYFNEWEALESSSLTSTTKQRALPIAVTTNGLMDRRTIINSL